MTGTKSVLQALLNPFNKYKASDSETLTTGNHGVQTKHQSQGQQQIEATFVDTIESKSTGTVGVPFSQGNDGQQSALQMFQLQQVAMDLNSYLPPRELTTTNVRSLYDALIEGSANSNKYSEYAAEKNPAAYERSADIFLEVPCKPEADEDHSGIKNKGSDNSLSTQASGESSPLMSSPNSATALSRPSYTLGKPAVISIDGTKRTSAGKDVSDTYMTSEPQIAEKSTSQRERYVMLPGGMFAKPSDVFVESLPNGAGRQPTGCLAMSLQDMLTRYDSLDAHYRKLKEENARLRKVVFDVYKTAPSVHPDVSEHAAAMKKSLGYERDLTNCQFDIISTRQNEHEHVPYYQTKSTVNELPNGVTVHHTVHQPHGSTHVKGEVPPGKVQVGQLKDMNASGKDKIAQNRRLQSRSKVSREESQPRLGRKTVTYVETPY